MLSLMQHKIIGIRELLIYDTVCFVFPVCTGLKETVVGEEEMNVLKSFKYLYTEVIAWFTQNMASFGNRHNQQEENTMLC